MINIDYHWSLIIIIDDHDYFDNIFVDDNGEAKWDAAWDFDH